MQGSAYGLEKSQQSVTPSACALVVELQILPISFVGPFGLLVAFVVTLSSKHSHKHLLFLPGG